MSLQKAMNRKDYRASKMVSLKDVCKKATKLSKVLPAPHICLHLYKGLCLQTQAVLSKVLQHKYWRSHSASPLGQSNVTNPTFRAVGWTADLPLPWHPLTLERVKLVFPPISLEMQKSRQVKERSQSCVFVSPQVTSPFPRRGPNLLLQCVFYSLVLQLQ